MEDWLVKCQRELWEFCKDSIGGLYNLKLEPVVLASWHWKIAVTYKIPECIKWKLCFSGTIEPSQVRMNNQLWLRGGQHHWDKIFGEVFSQVSTEKLQSSGCWFCAVWKQLNLIICKCLLGGIGFEDMKGSWRTSETWHCKKPEVAISEDVASFVVEALGLNKSWRKIEACHHVAGSISLKRSQEMLSVRVKSSWDKYPSILAVPVLWNDHQGQ